jgi:hypothetical protein
VTSDGKSGVTVVVPAFKAVNTLHATIESCCGDEVIDQLIIVCNGDIETFHLASKIRDSYKDRINIQVIPPLNYLLTASQNWTRACELSNSKYTKLLCADDLVTPNSTTISYEFLEKNPNCDFVSTQRKIIDSHGKTIFSRSGGFFLKRVNSRKRLIYSVLLRGTNVVGEPSAVLFRTTALKKALPWNQSIQYVTDLEMYFRVLLENQGFFGFIAEPLACFRINLNSWSNELTKTQVFDFVQFVKLIVPNKHLKPLIIPYVTLVANFNAFARNQIYRRLNRNGF